jgi:hypothetical protein
MDQELYADLDALIAQDLRVKCNGKILTIRAIDTLSFMNFSNEWLALLDVMKLPSITEAELKERYVKLFKTLSPDIDVSIVDGMRQEQIAGFFQACIESVTGRAHAKKKAMAAPTTT